MQYLIYSACNQTDEEDIDIVGDDKERANTSLSSSSGGGANSSDAAVTASVIYGPPQFTEADVLACVASAAAAPAEAERAERAGGRSEEEAAAEAEDSEKENVVKKELMEDEVEQEKEDVEALKAKVRKLEENNKCSKCTVSYESLLASAPAVNAKPCDRCATDPSPLTLHCPFQKSLSSPVVNVACWHIQCERCWLLSVVSKEQTSIQ